GGRKRRSIDPAFGINFATPVAFHPPKPLDRRACVRRAPSTERKGRMRSKTGTALVALLTALLVVGAASAKSQHSSAGGTLNVDLTTDIDYTDPALSYLSTGWELEFATCLKLMNYPDANGPRASQLVTEAAAGFPKVSNSGKTY